MKTSKEQLRLLLAQIIAAHESEKARFARTLHDDLSQKLTALLIEISLLESSFAPASKEARKIADLSEMVSSISQSVRRLTNELRLKILDEFGLVAALKHETQKLSKESGVQFVFIPPADESGITPEIGAELFKMFQKIVAKILELRKTGEILVHIVNNPQALSLRISETRRKTDSKKLFARNTLEWLDLRERAFRLNGEIELMQARGKSVAVTITIRKKKR